MINQNKLQKDILDNLFEIKNRFIKKLFVQNIEGGKVICINNVALYPVKLDNWYMRDDKLNETQVNFFNMLSQFDDQEELFYVEEVKDTEVKLYMIKLQLDDTFYLIDKKYLRYYNLDDIVFWGKKKQPNAPIYISSKEDLHTCIGMILPIRKG